MNLDFLAMEGELLVRDGQVKELAHVEAVQQSTYLQADLVLAPQGPRLPVHAVLDALQLLLGAREQLLSPPGPIMGKDGIPAHNQTLAWVGRILNLSEIHLLEQRRLKCTLLDQLADGGLAQGRDPVQPHWPQVLLDPHRTEDAAVGDEYDVLEPEPLPHFLDLPLQGACL